MATKKSTRRTAAKAANDPIAKPRKLRAAELRALGLRVEAILAEPDVPRQDERKLVEATASEGIGFVDKGDLAPEAIHRALCVLKFLRVNLTERGDDIILSDDEQYGAGICMGAAIETIEAHADVIAGLLRRVPLSALPPADTRAEVQA